MHFFVWEKIHLRLVEDLRFFAKHFVIFARKEILKFKALEHIINLRASTITGCSIQQISHIKAHVFLSIYVIHI